jgi:thioredoxin reductase (NADPH)
MKDLLVVGKGPAGISAAIYAKRAGLDVIVIGKGFGALGKTDKINNFYGHESVMTGMDLVEQGIKQAENLGVEVVNDEVIGVSWNGNFIVKDTKKEYEAKAVVLATGSSRITPKIKGVKEFEGHGVSYCAVCDAFFYRGKDVAILGSGKYAVAEAEELVHVVNSVTILTDGKDMTCAVPENIKVNKGKLVEFKGDDKISGAVFEDGSELTVDGLFIAVGVAGSTDFALTLGAMVEKNKIVVDEDMKTNIPGLFAAGDCIGGMYQVYKAVSDGSIAGTRVAAFIRGL